jgi:hypothetical protein
VTNRDLCVVHPSKSSFSNDVSLFSIFPLNTSSGLIHEHINVGTIRTRDVQLFFSYSVSLQIKRIHSAGSKAWVCSRSLPGTAIPNPSGDMGLSLVNILCCQVEVSATGRSVIQRSPPETERERVCVCH